MFSVVDIVVAATIRSVRAHLIRMNVTTKEVHLSNWKHGGALPTCGFWLDLIILHETCQGITCMQYALSQTTPANSNVVQKTSALLYRRI